MKKNKALAFVSPRHGATKRSAPSPAHGDSISYAPPEKKSRGRTPKSNHVTRFSGLGAEIDTEMKNGFGGYLGPRSWTSVSVVFLDAVEGEI